MTTATEFIKEIDAFLKRQKMAATRFGYLSMGDPGLVFGLRNGRDPRLSTIDKLRQFMVDAGGAKGRGR